MSAERNATLGRDSGDYQTPNIKHRTSNTEHRTLKTENLLFFRIGLIAAGAGDAADGQEQSNDCFCYVRSGVLVVQSQR